VLLLPHDGSRQKPYTLNACVLLDTLGFCPPRTAPRDFLRQPHNFTLPLILPAIALFPWIDKGNFTHFKVFDITRGDRGVVVFRN